MRVHVLGRQLSKEMPLPVDSELPPDPQVDLELPPDDSVDDLLEVVTQHILADLSRGYFEQHRLLVALHLCLEMAWLSGEVSEAQQALLFKGEGALTESQGGVRNDSLPKQSPDLQVFSASSWEAVRALAILEPTDFAELPGHVVANLEEWREALALDGVAEDEELSRQAEAEDAEASESLCWGLPGQWGEPDLSPMSQLLLLRAVQPARLAWGLRCFTQRTLGERCLAKLREPSLRDAFEASRARVPLLVVLTQGSDPAAEITREAENWPGGPRDLRSISFGWGRGEHAQRLLDDGVQHGWWVLLQNCHLASSWLPHLERFVAQSLADEKAPVHECFRLFLTALPQPRLPPALLRQCAKLAHQPPRGVRAGLLRSLNGPAGRHWDFDDEPGWQRLVMGLSLFHAVVCERSKFGLLGFSHTYRFTDGDLEAAHSALELLWEAGTGETGISSLAHLPWQALEHLVARVHYGGHVTDRFDERCLLAAFVRLVFRGQLGDGGPAAAGEGPYALPEDLTELSSARAFAESLPWHEPPSLLGLPSGAGAALRPRLAREALEALELMHSAALRREDAGLSEQVEACASPAFGETLLRPALSTFGSDTLSSHGTQVWGRSATFVGSTAFGPAGAAPAVVGPHAGDAGASAEDLTRGVLERMQLDVPRPGGGAAGAAGQANAPSAPSPGAPRSLRARRASNVGLRRNSLAHADTVEARPCDPMLAGTLSAFLKLELARLDRLLKVVHESLASLSDVVAGLASSSDELDAMMATLREGRVLESWRAVAYPSCRSLHAWVADLQDRSAWLWGWARQGEVPACFPLVRFFCPEGFLTSVLQGFARGTGSYLNDVGFEHVVSSFTDAAQVEQGPDRGVYVSGLFLEAAHWDLGAGQLEECQPGELLSRMPIIRFSPTTLVAEAPHDEEGPALAAKTVAAEVTSQGPTPASSARSSLRGVAAGGPAAARTSYECPLYRTASRGFAVALPGRTRGLICTVDLPTSSEPSHWVLRGTALLCDVET